MNIIICDDETRYIENLMSLIKKYLPQEMNCEFFTFNSGEDFLCFINQDVPIDIVFMDIEMKEVSGIESIRALNEKYVDTIVFFVTSHNEYVSELFRLKAFQFIQKPIDEQTFALDFNRAVQSYINSRKSILVKANGESILIEHGAIKYIEVNQKKITIHTLNGDTTHYGKLEDYSEELSPYGFVKTHKSFLVNLKYVSKVDFESIEILKCDKYIPLSRGYKEEFLNRFRKYCMGMCV